MYIRIDMPRKSSTGNRFNLGDPWDTDLNAFCAALLGVDRTKVARQAISDYIREFIAKNDGVREEYERQRAEMLGRKSDKVTVLRSNGK